MYDVRQDSAVALDAKQGEITKDDAHPEKQGNNTNI